MDFVLICVYVVVLKFNWCKLVDIVEIENIRYFFGNNLMYENIEIVFINWNIFFYIECKYFLMILKINVNYRILFYDILIFYKYFVK